MDVYSLTDVALLALIGRKVKETRLEQNIKQKDVAENAGISVFALSSLENGHNCSLMTLIQVLRAMNRLDLLEVFFQEKQISPTAYARILDGEKVRERATKSVKGKNTESEW